MRYRRPVIILLVLLVAWLVSCGGPAAADRTPAGGTAPAETPGNALPGPTAQPTEIGLCPPSSLARGDELSATEQPTLTIADFAFLERGIGPGQVERRVGPPDEESGFGLFSVEYNRLADGCIVRLAYSSGETYSHLMYAAFECSDGSGAVLVPWK